MTRWLSIFLAVVVGWFLPANAHALTRAGQAAYDGGAALEKVVFVAGITMDTDEGQRQQPLSLHKYLYVADNPVNHVDPTGHDLTDVLVAGALAGTLAAIGTPYTANAPGPNDITYPAITASELEANFVVGFTFGVGGYLLGQFHPSASPAFKPTPTLADVFEGKETGQGFSGVYNGSQNGAVALRLVPSKRLQPGEPLPQGYVNASGGHGIVNQTLESLGYDPSQSYGFTVFLQQDGSLEVQWLSRSVNGRNFGDPVVPEAVRPQIVQVLEQQTGKKVTKQ